MNRTSAAARARLALFLTGALLLEGWLVCPPVHAQAGLQAPSRRGQSKGVPDWVWYVGGGAGLLMVIFFSAIFFKKKDITTKRAGGVQVSDNQVDNYRLLNLMMTGQTSQVWEVAELGSGRHFAMKMLLPEHIKNPDQRQFLFHEAEVGKQIIHPNVIRILEIIKDPSHPYILMEFFPSKNLKLRLMHKEQEYLKENLRKIIEQASLGLAFMHDRGWVHRDIKPDNLLANANADLRIIDFALTQRLSKKKGKKSGKVQGTRSYMSPEQIRGEGLDGRADMYSFAVTLFELMTGRPPFRAATAQDLLTKHMIEKAPSPQLFNADVSDEMSELLLRMLNKKREDRLRDMQEFIIKFRGVKYLYKSQMPQRPGGVKKS